MDPSGPAQPPSSAAYSTEGNPATSNPAERRGAQGRTHARPIDERVPTSQAPDAQDAMPSSLGYGIRGAPPGEERPGGAEEQVGRRRELEGDQMRALDEGDVADAVGRKPGASGSEPDLAGDLDRKKQEQATKRENIKDQKRHDRLSEFGDARATRQEGLNEA